MIRALWHLSAAYLWFKFAVELWDALHGIDALLCLAGSSACILVGFQQAMIALSAMGRNQER